MPTYEDCLEQTENEIIAMLLDKLKITEDMANGYKALYEAEKHKSEYLEKYYGSNK